MAELGRCGGDGRRPEERGTNMAWRTWHDEHGTNGTGFELPGTFFCAARGRVAATRVVCTHCRERPAHGCTESPLSICLDTDWDGDLVSTNITCL